MTSSRGLGLDPVSVPQALMLDPLVLPKYLDLGLRLDLPDLISAVKLEQLALDFIALKIARVALYQDVRRLVLVPNKDPAQNLA